METIYITKAQLQAAIGEWVQDTRDGKTLDPAEVAKMTVEQETAEGTQQLWDALKSKQG